MSTVVVIIMEWCKAFKSTRPGMGKLGWLLFLNLLNNQCVAATRETVAFDFGWKHRPGLTDWALPNDLPPTATDPGIHPPESKKNYDDSDWIDVQLPHDALIVNPPSQEACPDGCSGRSYIPRHVLWYRKTFSLPQEWLLEDNATSVFSLEFEGSFRNTTVWLNGELVLTHVCGYTPFQISLERHLLSPANSDGSNEQTIAVFVDPDNGDEGGPSHGSGWWYEGGGLYRHVRLTKTHAVRVAPHGLFVKSSIQGSEIKQGKASTATIEMESTVVNPMPGYYKYRFELTSPDGQEKIALSEPTLLPKPTSPEEMIIVKSRMEISDVKLWSSTNPNLYQVDFVIFASCCEDDDGNEVDRVSVRHGVRTLRFDANEGFFLNNEHYKIRGFCDHDTFAVVGMAVPDRVNLFRAQASRSIGGNGRRTSHNPPDPTLLDIYDRLGMVVMDENRLFDDNPEYVKNMGVLVQRDRNHPSIVIWSFCNEGKTSSQFHIPWIPLCLCKTISHAQTLIYTIVGCRGSHQNGGPAFQAVTEQFDGTRPTLANMMTFNDLLSHTVDVQGLSHPRRRLLDDCHTAMPDKPIFASECCSCNTMRGEDEGCETAKDNPHYTCNQKAFNARCLDLLVNASDGIDYSAGTMVWTLFDYYGEPPSAGLTVSSTYGQFDLCGFPKSAAFWFRSQWLLGVSDSRVDKPFSTHGAHEVHIVEYWESPNNWNETKGNKTRAIHAYTNAPFVELFANGESQGILPVVPMVTGAGGSYAEWPTVPWAPGSLTAVARSVNGTSVAQASRATNGQVAGLVLSLDSPSESTGTGRALFLDGQDVALVRATIVDSFGHVSHLATNNVTFSIVSGPGRIQGTANGDAKSYQSHVSSSHTAYHGLVRAIVRVTSIAGLSEREKDLITLVDGTNAASAGISISNAEDIVIEASSPGLPPTRLRIPTSTDPATASVLAVAEAAAGKPVNHFHELPPPINLVQESSEMAA